SSRTAGPEDRWSLTSARAGRGKAPLSSFAVTGASSNAMPTRVTKRIGSPGIVRARCLAHVRRKFADALKLDPQDREAAAVLLLMGKLYAVEREAREAGATHEQRLPLRQQRSAALLEELEAKITKRALNALLSSKLTEACQYALNQWARLKVYLQNGRIEIDQNLCENAMRPVARSGE